MRGVLIGLLVWISLSVVLAPLLGKFLKHRLRDESFPVPPEGVRDRPAPQKEQREGQEPS